MSATKEKRRYHNSGIKVYEAYFVNKGQLRDNVKVIIPTE